MLINFDRRHPEKSAKRLRPNWKNMPHCLKMALWQLTNFEQKHILKIMIGYHYFNFFIFASFIIDNLNLDEKKVEDCILFSIK
ncbi:unnamed protein product [Onchocerca flexuosa]|uniref:Uncharacterized protein n=1 Tax=Onchocerca flexuosa TaxID=387005 RepID=A0A183H2K1_9BILA|nr:unnamed protein product [Onchocerca flexuosa]